MSVLHVSEKTDSMGGNQRVQKNNSNGPAIVNITNIGTSDTNSDNSSNNKRNEAKHTQINTMLIAPDVYINKIGDRLEITNSTRITRPSATFNLCAGLPIRLGISFYGYKDMVTVSRLPVYFRKIAQADFLGKLTEVYEVHRLSTGIVPSVLIATLEVADGIVEKIVYNRKIARIKNAKQIGISIWHIVKMERSLGAYRCRSHQLGIFLSTCCKEHVLIKDVVETGRLMTVIAQMEDNITTIEFTFMIVDDVFDLVGLRHIN